MSLTERLEKQKRALSSSAAESPAKAEPSAGPVSDQAEAAPGIRFGRSDEYIELKDRIHREVIDLANQDSEEGQIDDADREEYFKKLIDSLISAKGVTMPRSDRTRITNEIYNDLIGLGPLEPLLADPDITEIMVNGPDSVYVEIHGKIELTDVRFRNSEHVMNIIGRIVSAVGRRIDESSPMVDARLSDGSRVNAIIPPLSLTGPTITIRKFPKNPLTVSDLIRFTSVSPQMVSFLEACVKGRLNVIVSGGTGSGKTTLLGVLSGFIPGNERIVTIEDAAELQLRQRHVITLESRPANIEGVGAITIRDLVRNALRMRPDRIIVGEVRSGETLDMLQAMNTGHDGSLTTAHANSPRDLISRLETMVLMSGMELPVKAIREQISSALDLIVHQARLKDGTRKIVSISEVIGMESDTVVLQDLFLFEHQSMESGKVRGRFVATGARPQFTEKLSASGVMLRDDWFQN